MGANIREAANAKSPVLRTATAGQTLILADSANGKWLKASFHDSIGYISRRFADIAHVHHDQVAESQLEMTDPYAAYLLVLGLIGFVLWIRWLKQWDQRRFEVELTKWMNSLSKFTSNLLIILQRSPVR